MNNIIRKAFSNKAVWKALYQTAITILTTLGTVFGLQSCGLVF